MGINLDKFVEDRFFKKTSHQQRHVEQVESLSVVAIVIIVVVVAVVVIVVVVVAVVKYFVYLHRSSGEQLLKFVCLREKLSRKKLFLFFSKLIFCLFKGRTRFRNLALKG